MEQRHPLCGNAQAHAKHGFWITAAAWNECSGWTDAEAATTELIEQMNKVGREAFWPLKMPEGIRLECHPAVVHHLQQMFIPGYAEFASGEADLLKPQIPVICVAIERGAWKLASDAGMIAEGVIPE